LDLEVALQESRRLAVENARLSKYVKDLDTVLTSVGLNYNEVEENGTLNKYSLGVKSFTDGYSKSPTNINSSTNNNSTSNILNDHIGESTLDLLDDSSATEQLKKSQFVSNL
jgi:hypothetical protein